MPSDRWAALRVAVLRSAAVGVVAALALAGCGGDDDSGGGGGGGPVTIGILVPLTGELGDFGKNWQRSAQLAVDQLNKSGALPKGTRIKTVVADEKANAQTAVTEGRKMISTQNVQAIVGPTSEPMVALTPIAKREKIPVVSGAAGTVQLNNLGGDYIYRTVASDASDGLAQAKFLQDKKATDVAQLIENDASPTSVATTFKDAFEKSGGKIIESVTFNPKQAAYRSEVEKVLSAKPKWIVCSCGQQSGASIIKEVTNSGYDGEWMVSSDLGTADVIKTVGPDIMNDRFFSEAPSADTKLPTYQEYAAALKAKYGNEPSLLDANVYDAMMLVGLAIAKSGSTKGEDINSALRDVAGPPGQKVTTPEQAAKALKGGGDVDYDGASGPVDFDDTGSVTNSYAMVQVKDGAWKQITFYPADQFKGQ